MVGSAPRARGTRGPSDERRAGNRFSPAGAGNTRSRPSRRRTRTVQPRGRGEHCWTLCGRWRWFGSAPRARGTLEQVPAIRELYRFSPAGAGNTPRRPPPKPPTAVQPRGRGEHSAQLATASSPYGSAPRARGTRVVGRFYTRMVRFSPAGAGNTAPFEIGTLCSPVQPRGRGEHSSLSWWQSIKSGSAPRARGTRDPTGCRRGCVRFSPAGAGNTAGAIGYRKGRPVQPRGRGEHGLIALARSLPVGSAPRARGTRRIGRTENDHLRFSPAGAGNTFSPMTRASIRPVQPRGRGEHDADGALDFYGLGSAPRARGTRTSR